MNLDDATRERLDSLIAAQDVTLFMKGNRQQPQCGFSATVVRILDSLIPEYQTVDVLADPAIREGIKVYSSWPTIPQLYVKGEFVGGCDILQELYASGELQETLGVAGEAGDDVAPPALTITPAAARALEQASAQSGGGREIHLGVDARFQSSLFFAPAAPGEIAVESEGVRVLLDPMSARRAEGVTIDAVDTDRGTGFHIDNPNAPNVQSMSVEDLKALIDTGDSFLLLDVRSPDEREVAAIPGSTLLTEDEAQRLESLPRDTKLVFHCHHGGRSQAAAQHFAAKGFRDVHNVVGGIDAWAQQIDPDVARY